MPIGNRSMGLDVGSKTVGVAISDLMGWTAQGIETISIDEESGDFGYQRLQELIEEYKVDKIIIGLPKNMNNTMGPRAEASQTFGENLQKLVPDCQIIYQDERLTTSQAQRMLIEEGNVSRKKRKKVIDKLAAVMILQNYLNYKK
ncbi:Holliday junction resolvase RuvX [Facklamia sp. 7083-14-GEN3]|uniref:Holliday junction resolvase RuvX n=1 Tax=Facklamia sp. 7083-14-GEN3 TaxID=2973478 RepID=UPI00215BF4FF|nr:Holliday junction resolvase RuvX [Facklamia sp. 7083-14-GEN3]MCR8969098.1 Holliday junction resolvase RuvX [Facklamia sp. 7083-14-GEN3]